MLLFVSPTQINKESCACSSRISLIFSAIITFCSKPCIICALMMNDNKDLSKVTLLDFFVDQAMTLTCDYERSFRKSQVVWKFEGFDKAKRLYYPVNLTYIHVDVTAHHDSSQLVVYPLVISDSGRYDCVANRKICSFSVGIHDPKLMDYVIKARGQSPWEDAVVSEYQVGLEWMEWTECDGCSGRGERRKFGFCYVTWSEGRVQCRSPSVPFPLKAIARSRREEIVVDVCYDQCVEEDVPLLVNSQRLDVINGADVTLTCHANISVRSSIRWELDDHTVLRSDVSHGYRLTQPMYVTEDNKLLLHNIELPQGGVIRLACVEERRRRVAFNLHIRPSSDVEEVTFMDHLYWIGISTAVQITAFLFVMLCYVTAQNCVDDIKKQAHEFELVKQSDSDLDDGSDKNDSSDDVERDTGDDADSDNDADDSDEV